MLTTLGAEQNIDRLYWHLGRTSGYAEIANFMGAQFVVADTAMQPIIREAAKRGLGFLDDGSAPRSVAATLASSQAMPFAKADFSIDAVPTAAEIDRALAKLESLAKERGTAIGIASALPISIKRSALDQGAREPWHPACAIDNRDAEIKIGLKHLFGPAWLSRTRRCSPI